MRGHLFNTRGRSGCFIYGYARASRYWKRGARRSQACQIAMLRPCLVEGLHLPPAFHNPGQSTASVHRLWGTSATNPPERTRPLRAVFPTPNGGSPSTTSPFRIHPQKFPHCGETRCPTLPLQHDTPARGRCIHRRPSTSLWKPLTRASRNLLGRPRRRPQTP